MSRSDLDPVALVERGRICLIGLQGTGMKHMKLAGRMAALAVLCLPYIAGAESQLTVGAGTASARLNFQVIVPRVLFLAVGTGNGSLANNSTIDTVVFDYSSNPNALGTGAAAATCVYLATMVRLRSLQPAVVPG